MNKSLYTKIVVVILALIMALMTVIGAFLLRGVQNFYLNDFYDQMKTVFSSAAMVSDLRSAAAAGNTDQMDEILSVNSGQLGIDSGTRNYFILNGSNAQVLAASTAASSVKMTPNILLALSGTEGYESDSSNDYMDVALPFSGEGGSYIVYIIDNKATVQSLGDRLFDIIVNALGVGLVISVLLALLLAKALITPIQSLTKASERVAAGDFSAHLSNDATDEIGTLSRTFNEMAIQLEGSIEEMQRSEKMRKEFVANVSHELRTPITSIRTYAETLQESGGTMDEETVLHFLEVIVNEADRISKIVQDLLVLSKFDAGNYTFNYSSFSFQKSAESVFNAQALEARRRNMDFTFEAQGEIPEIIGDRMRIEQVVTNMVSNAIKYTPDGGKIVVSAGTANDKVWCKVQDNGIGIPQEDLDHIFERFYRVDKARSRESGGTGLGLSIAYEIVQHHNGTLTVSSDTGKGTLITVELPVEGPKND